MASRRDRLFEELGLLEEEEQVNPFEALGLNPDFARELLSEDRSGEAVRIAANGMYRSLSRLYHPDNGSLADDGRFQQIAQAKDRVLEASPAALSRWSKTERTASSAQTERLKAEQRDLLRQAGRQMEIGMGLGRHALHFSRLSLAQGVLLQRGPGLLLMRQKPDEGITVQSGYSPSRSKEDLSLDISSEAIDFRRFLQRHNSFGMEPGSRVAAYIDENGRASLLGSDLTFKMDITGPVSDVREGYETLGRSKREAAASATVWSRLSHPLLFITNVPSEHMEIAHNAQSVVFPGDVRGPGISQNLTSELPFEVAGSLADVDFYKRIRNTRAAGALALEGAGADIATYFNMLPTHGSQLIKLEAGYSPLLNAEAGLLLYDTVQHTPIVTDARIVGVIGNHSDAAR